VINKLFAQETFTATVEEDEIHEIFTRQNEKIQVSYVIISPNQFLNEATYDEEKAKEYYEQNKSEFTIPQSINVDYIHIPYAGDTLPEESDSDQITEVMEETKERASNIAEELKTKQIRILKRLRRIMI